MNKKQIAEISLELDRRRALVLDKYPTPIVLDKAQALAASAAKTKMGQPKVTAFYLTRAGIDEGFFTPQRDVTAADMVEPGVWYASKLSAMMAQRNRLLLTAADRLIALDGLIDETARSSIAAAFGEMLADAGIATPEVSGLVGDAAEQQEAEADAAAQAQGIETALPGADDGFMPEVPEYKAAQAEQAAEVEAAAAKKHPAAKGNRGKKASAEETV